MRGRRLRSTKSAGLRPTPERVRSAIFSIVGAEAVESARVLDLYAGTGALGFEALSRGASWCDFVESDLRRSQEIRSALREMGIADRARVHRARAERIAEVVQGPYDLVFADPPYDIDPWDSLMRQLSSGNMLHDGGFVVAEHRSQRDLAEQYGRLSLVTHRRYGDTAISVYRPGETNG